MESILESQAIDVLSNLVVGAVKSVARNNKRLAEILEDIKDLDTSIDNHAGFTDSIIAIIKPAISFLHDIISKFIPGYMYIVDLIIDLGQHIYEGITA